MSNLSCTEMKNFDNAGMWVNIACTIEKCSVQYINMNEWMNERKKKKWESAREWEWASEREKKCREEEKKLSNTYHTIYFDSFAW